MKERLEAIKKAALEKIEQADAMDSLNDIRVSVLGKKGELTQVLKGMKDVAKEERPIVGQMVNDTRAVSGRFRESIYRYGIRSCGRTRSRIR